MTIIYRKKVPFYTKQSKIVFNFFLIKFDLVVFLLLAVSSRLVVVVVVLELFV